MAMETDLEKYVQMPGRDELVEQVREKIDELGIRYIYYQFISVTGRIVGKGIPADHWERTAARGFQLVYGSTANLYVDRHGDPSRGGPRRHTMEVVVAVPMHVATPSLPPTAGSHHESRSRDRRPSHHDRRFDPHKPWCGAGSGRRRQER